MEPYVSMSFADCQEIFRIFVTEMEVFLLSQHFVHEILIVLIFLCLHRVLNYRELQQQKDLTQSEINNVNMTFY